MPRAPSQSSVRLAPLVLTSPGSEIASCLRERLTAAAVVEQEGALGAALESIDVATIVAVDLRAPVDATRAFAAAVRHSPAASRLWFGVGVAPMVGAHQRLHDVRAIGPLETAATAAVCLAAEHEAALTKRIQDITAARAFANLYGLPATATRVIIALALHVPSNRLPRLTGHHDGRAFTRYCSQSVYPHIDGVACLPDLTSRVLEFTRRFGRLAT